MSALIDALRSAVGERHVLTDGDLSAWELDWRKRYRGRALAVVRPDGTTVRLLGLAAPPGRHDLAVQVLQGLVDALRAGSAHRLAAALPPDGHDVLRQAGFRQCTGAWAVDL